MKKTIVKHDASDPKAGMSLRELEAFVRDVFAGIESGLPAGPVKIRTTWRGTIRSIQVIIEHGDS